MRTVIALAAASFLGLIGLSRVEPMPREARLARAQQRFQLGVDELRQPTQARRHFREAADHFGVLAGQAHSPALYLSLGNAEALAGRWPRAIWAYHCGLKIDPNDAVLRQHLEHARSLVTYPSGQRGRFTPDPWPAWLHRPTPAELLIVGLAAWGLAWGAGGWWYLRRGPLPLAATLGLLAITAASGIGYGLHERQATHDHDHPLLIVIDEATPLHQGNGSNYPLHPDIPTLPAGLEARLLHKRGMWLHIELSTGEVGWVPRDAVRAVQ